MDLGRECVKILYHIVVLMIIFTNLPTYLSEIHSYFYHSVHKDKLHISFIALTSLWAFVESGLGGIMHALHLPFTGIVLGGFSVLIISLLAHQNTHIASQIIKATLIVIAVKASVNPMTSPTAYIAVAFQGLLGALFFSISKKNMLISIAFATIAMVESGIQKLLILMLIFGKTWINALDSYTESVLQLLGFEAKTPASVYIVGGYLGVFVLWGIVLGVWIYLLPAQLESRNGKYNHIQPDMIAENVRIKSQKKKYFGLILGFILLFSVSYFFFETKNSLSNALHLLTRTICILGVWIYLVLPLWSKMMQNWLQKQQDKHKEMEAVLTFMPKIALYVKPLYRHADAHYNGIAKWREFVLSLMVISLNLGDEKQ